MLAETIKTIREIGHDELARLLQDYWNFTSQDLMAPSYLLFKQNWRQTVGHLENIG
jgi:hypothetical protein